MPIRTVFLKPMIDFIALLNHICANRLYDSYIHGVEHWSQVEFNGLLLAPKTGADILVVKLFSLFHDSQRVNDGYDLEHGPRGAEFAAKCRQEGLLELDDERFDLLYRACQQHTKTPRTGDPTIDTCFDADRLDLGRVSIVLNPNKMATSFGANLAHKALSESVPTFKMREWIRNQIKLT